MHDTLFKRQIRWAIGAKSLVNADYTPPQVTEFTFAANKLSRQQETELAAWMEHQPRSNRIGLQFEQAFAAYLHNQTLAGHSQDLRYQAIQQRLQVHQGQTKRTIGEFDFVFKDKSADLWVHTEIAVKFYLGTGNDLSQLSAWIGPNKRDRLDLKYDKLFHHQLQLSDNPLAQATLRDLNIDQQTLVKQYCLKGILFLPWHDTHGPPISANDAAMQIMLPKEINKHCQLGFWIAIDQLHLLHTDKVQWLILDRDEWISWEQDSVAAAYAKCGCLIDDWQKLFNNLISLLEKYKNPVQIIRVCPNTEPKETRYFVTPTGWSETTSPFLTQ